MEKMTVRRDEMVYLDEIRGNLIVEDGAVLVPKRDWIMVHGDVIVKGSARVEGSMKARRASVDGSLEVAGSLDVTEKVRCEVVLKVENDLHAGRNIVVGDVARIKGSLIAQQVKVGGRLEVGNETKVRTVKVGGSVELRDVNCDELIAGGWINITGSHSDVDVIKAGGSVVIVGGRYNTVKAGGQLNIQGDATIETAKVGGIIESSGNITVGAIKVGGQIVHHGDLKARVLKAGGKAEIFGKFTGTEASIGGKLEVAHDAFIENDLKVGGAVEVKGSLEASFIVIGGELLATRVKATEVRVGSQVVVADYLRAGYFQLGRRGRCEGHIIADEIVILDKAVVVGDLSGNIIILKRGVKVKGKIQYVNELRMEDDVQFDVTPTQISSLPDN